MINPCLIFHDIACSRSWRRIPLIKVSRFQQERTMENFLMIRLDDNWCTLTDIPHFPMYKNLWLLCVDIPNCSSIVSYIIPISPFDAELIATLLYLVNSHIRHSLTNQTRFVDFRARISWLYRLSDQYEGTPLESDTLDWIFQIGTLRSNAVCYLGALLAPGSCNFYSVGFSRVSSSARVRFFHEFTYLVF